MGFKLLEVCDKEVMAWLWNRLLYPYIQQNKMQIHQGFFTSIIAIATLSGTIDLSEGDTKQRPRLENNYKVFSI